MEIKVKTAGYTQDKTWLGQKTSKSVPTCGKILFGQMKPRLTFNRLMGRETFGKGKEELITCQRRWRQSCLGHVWLLMEPRHEWLLMTWLLIEVAGWILKYSSDWLPISPAPLLDTVQKGYGCSEFVKRSLKCVYSFGVFRMTQVWL